MVTKQGGDLRFPPFLPICFAYIYLALTILLLSLPTCFAPARQQSRLSPSRWYLSRDTFITNSLTFIDLLSLPYFSLFNYLT